MATVTRPVSLPIAPLSGDFEAIVSPGNDERLSALIARLIARRTAGRVAELRVVVCDDLVQLEGFCASYYIKQLAQHATMDLVCGATIVNQIQVEA